MMHIKLRKSNKDGSIRVESGGEIKEILINEDFLQPGNESISVCFRGKDSSGIIDFSPMELQEIYKMTKNRVHLIKGAGIF